MTTARKFGIVLGLLLLVAVPVGLLGPTRPDLSSYDTDTYDTAPYDSAVSAALSDATSNEARSQGAPQQAVVNGWLARDLAIIQIKQANDQLTQNVTRIRQTNDLLVVEHTIAAVLVAMVLALVFVGLITRKPDEVVPAREGVAQHGFRMAPGSPSGDREASAPWPSAATQIRDDEQRTDFDPRPVAPGMQATTTLPRTSRLPPPVSAVQARDHLVAEHGWPAQPEEAAMMEAHQFAHGAGGRADLADDDLAHTHAF